MNELSLFSGAGGGLLGTKLLGWRTIGYVENNAYCQAVLKARIADGILDEAPIFGDIKRFIGNGFAATYNGMVDVLTGGFPCQPFSVAGKGLAENDPRNMWPETIACIRIVKPRFALLENVPGLLQKPYFRRILREIAESGYDLRWGVLGASDVGANHRRKRLWILAYAKGEQGGRIFEQGFQPHIRTGCSNVADTKHAGLSKRRRIGDVGETGEGLRGISCNDGAGRPVKENEALANSSFERLENVGQKIGGKTPGSENGVLRDSGHWWAIEPNVGRVAYGMASRVDRLKAIGNGQVPAVVKRIWELMA